MEAIRPLGAREQGRNALCFIVEDEYRAYQMGLGSVSCKLLKRPAERRQVALRFMSYE